MDENESNNKNEESKHGGEGEHHELQISGPNKRLQPFKTPHLAKYALDVTDKDPLTDEVLQLTCKFCRFFGREHRPGMRRKSDAIKSFHPPFRTDMYRQHLDSQHADTWGLYQKLNSLQQQGFFDPETNPDFNIFADLSQPHPQLLVPSNQIVVPDAKFNSLNESLLKSDTLAAVESHSQSPKRIKCETNFSNISSVNSFAMESVSFPFEEKDRQEIDISEVVAAQWEPEVIGEANSGENNEEGRITIIGLSKNFNFNSFIEAFGFMSQMALISERLGHYPQWFNAVGIVKVRLATARYAKIGQNIVKREGISCKDIELAKRMDSTYRILQCDLRQIVSAESEHSDAVQKDSANLVTIENSDIQIAQNQARTQEGNISNDDTACPLDPLSKNADDCEGAVVDKYLGKRASQELSGNKKHK